MDKEKILHLIEEADDIVSALYRQGANKDYKCKSLREKLNAITEEIRANPETNADRIRKMTDEELADFLDTITDCCNAFAPKCDKCPMKYHDATPRCMIDLWLKQEVKDDESRK